jgi:hypothetical protein
MSDRTGVFNALGAIAPRLRLLLGGKSNHEEMQHRRLEDTKDL